ncbi:MAG TPA: glutamate--tRNA ligase [Thermoplasmata archaeon]|nr:glutamate--tRNA ligase [Thermoplasmata archaeon]
MPVDATVETRIRRLALENALQHSGAPRPGPILARLLATDPGLRAHAEELGPWVTSICREVGEQDRAAQESALSGLGGPEPKGRPAEGGGEAELPPLPGAEPGHVVLRLAPFPSGALHIGNARMLFINDAYRRRYDGKLLLVFDDTVGSEEKRVDLEVFDLIRHDLELAQISVDQVVYKSDRVPLFYPWAVRVIEHDAAYVCTCSAELLRENRRNGVACPERSQTRASTLEAWNRMLGGDYAPGQAVLRLRTDLNDPDPAFRDRVLFRISDLDHPRVGRRYKVWPLLEFSWAVDDLLLGVTHVLRGKDLVVEDRMEQYLWQLLGEHGPPFLHWGLLRVREAKISKSKSYAEVKSGTYDGWADPRTWSLASLERRGIRLDAVRQFTLAFGLSLADIEVPAETLYAENRKLIDATTPRRFYVGDPVRVAVDGFPAELAEVSLPNHPERQELGARALPAGPEFWLPRSELERHAGEEIRLKDLANILLPASGTPTDGAALPARFTSIENKRLPRIQWVGASGAVEVDLLDVDGRHLRGRAEASLRSARPGEVFQFERVGFVRIEDNWEPSTEPVRVCFGHP